MKRTDALTKIVSLLLFAAVAAYIGVYLIRSVSRDIRTAPAVYVSLTESATATGVIVRDETLVGSSKSYLSIVAENGRMLSAGETIAVSYNSEEAMARAGKLRELELQRQYIASVLNGRSSQETGCLWEKRCCDAGAAVKNHVLSEQTGGRKNADRGYPLLQ